MSEGFADLAEGRLWYERAGSGFPVEHLTMLVVSAASLFAPLIDVWPKISRA